MTPTSSSAGESPFKAGSVVILGWTNVGKSTLLNRLIETKLAAVADVAQTTRHRIRGVRWLSGRGQIVFIDTPGLHQPRYKMNRLMVESARQALVGVDLALLLIDAERGWGPGDRQAADWLHRSEVSCLLVLNKIDREVENVRAGWQWLAGRQDIETTAPYLENLWYFYKRKGWFQEALPALKQATLFGSASRAQT